VVEEAIEWVFVCFGAYADEWSRPIFNLTSNYKNLSREEREQRDYEQLPKKRRIRFVYVLRLFLVPLLLLFDG